MSAFLTPLSVELLTDEQGFDLKTRNGKQLWRVVDHPFMYQSDVAEKTLTIPVGFVTDFASIPVALSSVFGDIGQRASLPHDFEYSKKGSLPRDVADAVLKEACLVSGVSSIKANAIYAGVRAFGWMFFRKGD